MTRSERLRRGDLPFYLLAVVVNIVALGYVVLDTPTWDVAALEAGTTACLSLGFVYAGIRIARSDLPADGPIRVLLGVLVFGTIAMVVAALLIASRVLEGVVVPDEAFGVFLAWTWGAAFGAPLSFYHEQVRFQRQRLAATIDESRRLSRQLSVNQRIMRHNLRNDLNVIIGYTEPLLDRTTDPESVLMLDAIEAAARRLQTTAETFLSIQQVLEDEDAVVEFDLVAVVTRICEEAIVADSPVPVDESLPATSVVYAHRLLPGAIRELLTNAIQHNDVGDLELRVAVGPSPTTPGFTRLVISDTGEGLRPDEQHAIEGAAESPLSHPTGVGLWFVRTVIEQSGGSIDATATDPSGTTIQIELPNEPPA